MTDRRFELPGGGSLLLCSLFYSLVPVYVAFSGGSDFPFVFATAYSLGSGISGIAYLAVFNKGIWQDWRLFVPKRETVLKPLTSDMKAGSDFPAWNYLVLIALPRGLNVGFFALSVVFIPELIGTVLLESWPVFYVLLVQRLFSQDNQYVISTGKVYLMMCAFIGVALVVLSAESDTGGILSVSPLDMVLGLTFITCAIALNISIAASVRWSESVCAWLNAHKNGPKLVGAELERNKIGYFTICRTCTQLVSSVLSAAISGFSLGSCSIPNFLFIFIAGAFITTGGSYYNAKGTFRSSAKQQMQSVRFLTPVFGVLLLIAAGYSEGVNPWMFGTGFALVLVSNFYTNFLTKPNVKSSSD